ncbi:Uncharacterised protein [Klebsiella pneumoniae]|nr:Uncharacterised protein [Klebsiella pneumoniae]
MLEREMIENVLVAAAKKEGHSLNGQERLILRTRITSIISAERQRERVFESKVFQWIKPKIKRK